MFTFYFLSQSTGEVIAKHQRGATATRAYDNFLRFLRRTNTIRSGDVYQLVQYIGARDLDEPIPDTLWESRLRVAR